MKEPILWSLLAASALVACGGRIEPPAIRLTSTMSGTVAVEPAYFVVTRAEDTALDVAQIGAGRTVCPGGEERTLCRIEGVVLDRAALGSAEAVARRAIDSGAPVVHGTLEVDEGGRGVLVVRRVWTRSAAAPILVAARPQSDGFFALRDVSAACEHVATDCAWVRAEPLDGGRASHHAELDLALVGGALDPAALDGLAHGEVLVRGAPLGDSFVVASVYVPLSATGARIP